MLPALAIAGLLLATASSAHEIGTTRVMARFAPDGSYAIDLATDASVLLARLERVAGESQDPPSSIDGYQRRFDTACAALFSHVSILFDDRASVPLVSCVVDASGSASPGGLDALGVTATFRGVVPPLARTFRWRYDLTYASYALSIGAGAAAADETIWLDGAEESRPVLLAGPVVPRSHATVAGDYFQLGFTHILPKGLDHILFVMGLALLSRRLRPILWQVSAFTLAHTLTLGLTVYAVIDLPSSFVEPLIALSIVYVAVENLVTSELKPWRVALVFAFGLLHGMGFADALRDLALPRHQLLTALVAFNTGVEAGQLAVLLAAFLFVAALAARPDACRRWIVVPASASIALAGVFWMVQRLV